MVAFDCVLETHEAVQFTAKSHQELAAKIRQHRDEYHPEISDDKLREMLTMGTYDPEARATEAATEIPMAARTQ
jgi:ATP sulfurylase